MKPHLPLLISVLLAVSSNLAALPTADWLVNSAPFTARATPAPDGREVELANGLVRRVIRLKPNAATVAYDNLIRLTLLARDAGIRDVLLATLPRVAFDATAPAQSAQP